GRVSELRGAVHRPREDRSERTRRSLAPGDGRAADRCGSPRARARAASPTIADAPRTAAAERLRAGAYRDPGSGGVLTASATARAGRFAPLIAGCALALLLALPSSAGAHASLVTSTPRWGAVLAATPRSMTLAYDENVVPAFARVAVITPAGKNLAGPPD